MPHCSLKIPLLQLKTVCSNCKPSQPPEHTGTSSLNLSDALKKDKVCMEFTKLALLGVQLLQPRNQFVRRLFRKLFLRLKETQGGVTSIRQVHNLLSPPHLLLLLLLFLQMYLAAVSEEVTGERLHGKTSWASWVESSGRIFSTSVCLTERG